MPYGTAAEKLSAQQDIAAAVARRRLLVLFTLISVASALVFRENYRDRWELASRGLPTPEEMMKIIPNAHHLWIQRNILLKNPNGGINNENYRRCWFGAQAIIRGHIREDPQHAWQKICHLDADRDGVTNGQEMGDPCCTFSYDNPETTFFRSWDLSHPGNPHDPVDNRTDNRTHLPVSAGNRNRTQAKPVDCTAPWTEEDERRREESFQSFYFEKFEADKISADELFWLKLPLMAVMTFKFWRWCVQDGLLRDLLGFGPYALAAEGPDLTKLERASTLVLAFCWCDIVGGLTHLTFDYCPHYFPIIGGVAKGFQFHHHHPTGWVVVNFWTMMSHSVPLLGTLSIFLVFIKPRRAYRLFWVAVYSLTFTTALSHRWAHIPPAELPLWYRALQGSGFLMSHEHHMSHHRGEVPDTQFSNLSGKLDFIIDLLVKHVVPAWNYHFWITLTMLYMFVPIALGSAAFSSSRLHHKKVDDMVMNDVELSVDVEGATE